MSNPYVDPVPSQTAAAMRSTKRWFSTSAVTVLTCPPNDAMAEIHNRMPVILAESDWPKWLGEESATHEELLAPLRPCPDDWLKIWRVDNKVGNVKNNGPELILPLEEPLI
jgi:putative SOS response-associated peptidase YedK